MRIAFLAASLWLAVSVSGQDPARPAQGQADSEAILAGVKTGIVDFKREAGGEWIVQWHPATSTPSAIYGTGLPLADWRENSLAEARRQALRQLDLHRGMLGLGNSDFTESIGARMGRAWSFTFDQSFRGVPVIHGRADVRINMKGVVAMLGSRAWPIPADFDTTPALAVEVATAIAWDALGQTPNSVPQPGLPRQPRLVIWGDIDADSPAPVFLAWEIPISNIDTNGNGPAGRYYVDAKTGAVLSYANDKHECGIAGCTGGAVTAPPLADLLPAPAPIPTTVTVMGWSRTGADAYSALVNVPLPGLEVTVPGFGVRVTDQNGEFTIDINSPVTITVGQLDGRHHRPINGGSQPSVSVTVNPGVPATIQLLSAAATTAEAAHTTMTYWVDVTNEWCRSILGNSPQLNTASNVLPTVNIAQTCNATYTNNTINFYAAGGGCANTAFSTVIAHEWGHGLDDRYGGIFNSNAEGLSEGWGDILGMYLVDSPLLGSGFQTPGVALRRGDNNFVWPYSGSSPHAAGQVWMGFAWQFRQQLRAAFGTPQAIALSDEFVIGSIVANATNRVDAVREVFIASDDDGNLLNGTPYYAQLSAAAIIKGIPYPQIQVATIDHTPLASTTQRLLPRPVIAKVQPISGSINQVRVVFNAGAGNVVRTMHPLGTPDDYVALLPGIANGVVNYHIEATHSSNEIVRLPVTGSFSYTVDSGSFAPFWTQNFDSGAPGWTNGAISGTNEWQLGVPAGKSGTSLGVPWADPSSSPSAPNCYGVDLGQGSFNGRYAANSETWLRTPVINCSGRTGVRLRFKRWLSVEQAIYDQARILVNGQQIWQNPTNSNLQDTSWQTVEYLLPMADNNPSVQIEWRLKTDGALHMGGWHIDDVEIGETIPPTVDAELTLVPEQAVQGTQMTLTVTTPSGPRPYILAIGDSIGPTFVPGFPVVFVGGNAALFFGTTGANNSEVIQFPAPQVPSAIGLFFYSQVVTLDGTFTQFVTSNRYINLFTQTP